MCVAIVVEHKDGIPARYLHMMEVENPHGAGVAWADGDVLRFKKGLTWRDVRELQDELPRPFLLHFRWATHGPSVRRLAHPFVLGPRAFSRSLTGSCKALLIHNGIWNRYDKHLPPGIADDGTISDTQVAAYVAGTDEDILDDVDWATAVGRAGGNGRMDITLRGRWMDFEGNTYSNLQWLLYSKRPDSPVTQATHRFHSGSHCTSMNSDTPPMGVSVLSPSGVVAENRNFSPARKPCTRCGNLIGHQFSCPNSKAAIAMRRRRNDDKAYETWLADHAAVQRQLELLAIE